MYVVPYAITLAKSPVRPPISGVQGASVRQIAHDALTCFYSQLPQLAQEAEEVKRDALAFHRVIQELLRQAPLIPFRFVTALAGSAELQQFLSEHASEYPEQLEKFRDLVQMELHVAWPEEEAKPQLMTGTDYMRLKQGKLGKLSELADCIQAHVGGVVEEWRRREGKAHMRMYALVKRDKVNDFRSAVQTLSLLPRYVARHSGPWPATEFMALRHDAGEL